MSSAFILVVIALGLALLGVWSALKDSEPSGKKPGKPSPRVVRASAVVGGGDYASLLRDPRWLAKRRRIVARDGGRCVWCGSREGLQVHHKFYARYPGGRYADPWDYQDNALVTLCRRCHERWHATHANKVYWRGRGVRYDM